MLILSHYLEIAVRLSESPLCQNLICLQAPHKYAAFTVLQSDSFLATAFSLCLENNKTVEPLKDRAYCLKFNNGRILIKLIVFPKFT